MSSPGRAGGPSIQIEKPEKFVGTSTPVEVVVSAPGAQISKPSRSSSSRTASRRRCTRWRTGSRAARASSRMAPTSFASPGTIGKQDGSRSQDRAGANHRHGFAAGAARIADAAVERQPRRAGPPRTPAGLDRLDEALHQPRRDRRWSSIARRRPTSLRRARRRHRVSGLSRRQARRRSKA